MITPAIARLSEFVSKLQFEHLPPDVVKQTQLFFLDAVGCAYAAYKEDAHKAKVAGDLAANFGSGPAGVIGGHNTHPAAAALANGMLTNAADNDDTHKRALIHIGSVVVPATLAAAQSQQNIGMHDFIAALVAGYEVTARVGMAVMPTHYRFWHSTATNGTFGAGASVARAWRMNPDQVRNVFGYAGTQAAGLNTFFESGDDSKSVHPGKAAMNGYLAALLTQVGASSPPDIFGHPKGYLAAYSVEPKPEALTQGLGETWEILQNGFKFYPSILASHSPIGATLEVLSKGRIDPKDVQSVHVRTYATVKSHFSSKEIQKTMAARLSVPYCVAAAIVDGEITQRQFSPDRFNDPVIRGILDKVEVIADPDLNPLYPEKFPARVIIALKTGESREATFMYPKGDPNNPLSESELIAKFRGNLEGVVSASRADRLVQMIQDLPNAKLADLSKALTKE